MLEKFLKDIVVIVVGKQAEEIADMLNSNKHVNEFLIAKKLDITINQARNILYKLSDQGLVSFIRKKDKKKGWYTYFWKFEILKCLEFLRSILLRKIDYLNNQIRNRESHEFYVCERCNIELNSETALLYNFTCNECGDIFTIKDNTKMLRDLNRELDKLNKELGLVDEEIEKEKQRLDKIKEKEIKKREKEKKAKREAAKEARKKTAKKSAAKKTTAKKKTSVKKVVKKTVKKSAKKKVNKKTTTKKKPVSKKKTATKRPVKKNTKKTSKKSSKKTTKKKVKK